MTMRNNVVDIFFDGTLKKSCILKGFPILSNNDMLVCPDGGFNGYISNMKYSNKALPVTLLSQCINLVLHYNFFKFTIYFFILLL